MALATAFIDDLLKLLFQGTAIANLADNAASGALTSLYISLHTASPGAGGSQTTNETSYTGYTRIAVVRTSGGWAVSSGVATPVSTIAFPTVSSGSGTITYAAIGTAISGTGKLLFFGTVSPNITLTVGEQPRLTNASTITGS